MKYKMAFSSIDFTNARNGSDCRRILDREHEKQATERSNNPLVKKNPDVISQSDHVMPSGRSEAANT